jgi:hypothetical protein
LNRLRQLPARCSNVAAVASSPSARARRAIEWSAIAYSSVVAALPQGASGLKLWTAAFAFFSWPM